MDVNGDGRIDVLSGSYSRQESDMAGLFQVLWGQEGGGFAKAEILKGTDGEPLIIPAGQEAVTDKICTRPTAVDFDGDGDLDIVSGNFGGTFYLFEGQGDGKFAPTGTWLEGPKGKLQVDAHSDPVFADWDGDGDLDLLTGSVAGGAFLFVNEGSRTAPAFGERQVLVKPSERRPYDAEPIFGDAHLTEPQADTRLWVDDLNGDGKLDLLIGDSLTLHLIAEGKNAEQAKAALAKHAEVMNEIYEDYPRPADGEDAESEAYQEKLEAWQARMASADAERDETVAVQRTGFVWALHRQ